jgi:hypothetical protein
MFDDSFKTPSDDPSTIAHEEERSHRNKGEEKEREESDPSKYSSKALLRAKRPRLCH